MDLASALRMPSPAWINITPEKSFHSLRSLSRTMQAVNPTHVPFLSLTKSRYFNYYEKEYIKKNYLYKTKSSLYIISTRRFATINNVKLLININNYDRSSSNIFNSKN